MGVNTQKTPTPWQFSMKGFYVFIYFLVKFLIFIFYFYFLATLHGMLDLSSLTRD